MQRIPTLLKKIAELAEKGDKNSTIDIDLMLDYTKVIYADLLEWRNRKSFVSSLDIKAPSSNGETMQVQEEYEREEVPVVEEQEKEEVKNNTAPAVDKSTETTPAIEFAGNTPTAKPAADIRQSIGINDKYLFMSELFGNNRDDYEQALDSINSLYSYREAEKWFNENIDAAQANTDDNDTVELFRGTLQTFFNRK